MKKESKFIITFLIISSILYVLISIFYSENLPIIGTRNVALTYNNILSYIGVKTLIVDDTIYLPNNTALKIILECTGIYEMIILSSIILSYPTNIKNKFYGIIFGIVTIYILNMIRLISMSYILIYYTNKFDFIDRYIWQISLVIFISLTYITWLKAIERSNGQSNSLSSSE